MNARSIALELLESVLEKQQPFDQALEAHAGLRQLEARDRAFVRLLVATVLRRLGTLDSAINNALAKPGIPAVARNALRLGLAQLRYLQTPPHAALSTTVDLVATRAPGLKALVNAILRKADTLPFDESPGAALPEGLYRRWIRTYGADVAADIAVAILSEPPLDISVKQDPESWAQKLEAQILPLGTLRRAVEGPITALPGFDEGAWFVQDLAASLPAKLLGDVNGQTIYDLCAAPGGKTAQLAAAGAIVTAVDRSAGRLKRLSENMQRLHLNVTSVTANAATWQAPPADAILLDAPCTATGTIRRHPDVPHLKSAADLAALTKLQAELIDHAATFLKPGGRLIYCTCSLEPEEGEAQITALAERKTGLRSDPIAAAELPGLERLLTPEGAVRALPSYLAELGGIDGFFIARLVKE
jgi:16S rRNA (cytosine967-C5)-methyltransferase